MARKKMSIRRKQRKQTDHSAAFLVGSLLGGLTGAVVALWKTPQSGNELRAKLTGAIGMNDESRVTVIAEPATLPADVAVAAPEPPPAGIGHAATTDELTTPPSEPRA